MLTEIDVLVQSCGMANLIESGWPFFSLLALLRAGGVPSPKKQSLSRHTDGFWQSWPR